MIQNLNFEERFGNKWPILNVALVNVVRISTIARIASNIKSRTPKY